eukprot:jgi/Orpsp1_1/1179772/evm.model.c7180000070705.1
MDNYNFYSEYFEKLKQINAQDNEDNNIKFGILNEGYFEFEIDDFQSSLNNGNIENTIEFCEYQWKINLYSKNNDSIELCLRNINNQNEKNDPFLFKFIVLFRKLTKFENF